MVGRKALAAAVAAGLIFGSSIVTAAPAVANNLNSASDNSDGNGAVWLVGLLLLGGTIAVVASDRDGDVPVSR